MRTWRRDPHNVFKDIRISHVVSFRHPALPRTRDGEATVDYNLVILRYLVTVCLSYFIGFLNRQMIKIRHIRHTTNEKNVVMKIEILINTNFVAII